MGTEVLSRCDELWVYGDKITLCMMAEIEEAERFHISTRRVMECEQGFRIGERRNQAPRMEMGTLQ